MTKLLSPRFFGILIVSMGLMAHSSKATVIYFEDFETISSGWSTGTYAQGSVLFANGAASGPAFPTRSLELSHVSANTTRLISTMPANQYSVAKTSAETYTFQFDLRVSRTNTAGYVIFYDATYSSQLPMFIQITSAGDFVTSYWTGSENTTFTLLSGYTANTTYTFTFTTAPSTGLFSAQVTGSTNELVNQSYRRTSGGADVFQAFNRMQIYNDGGSAGGAPYDIYVDNINIQVIPEPQTAAILLLSGLILARFRRVQHSLRQA